VHLNRNIPPLFCSGTFLFFPPPLFFFFFLYQCGDVTTMIKNTESQFAKFIGMLPLLLFLSLPLPFFSPPG